MNFFSNDSDVAGRTSTIRFNRWFVSTTIKVMAYVVVKFSNGRKDILVGINSKLFFSKSLRIDVIKNKRSKDSGGKKAKWSLSLIPSFNFE